MVSVMVGLGRGRVQASEERALLWPVPWSLVTEILNW